MASGNCGRGGRLIHDQSMAGHGDVVAGGVLGFVHHRVGRAQDVVNGVAILREGGEAEAGEDAEGETFTLEETRFAKLFTKADSHGHCSLFAKVGQERDELISAVTEGIAGRAKTSFEHVAHFGQEA